MSSFVCEYRQRTLSSPSLSFFSFTWVKKWNCLNLEMKESLSLPPSLHAQVTNQSYLSISYSSASSSVLDLINSEFFKTVAEGTFGWEIGRGIRVLELDVFFSAIDEAEEFSLAGVVTADDEGVVDFLTGIFDPDFCRVLGAMDGDEAECLTSCWMTGEGGWDVKDGS